MPIITNNQPVYNQQLSGFFGEFGKGGGAQIFFIQTAITPNQLDKISLISDIEGSEKWEVRDLFQRDVDLDRVKEGLVPYLLDQSAIKFFNPLTLTFIPSDASHESFATSIPQIPLRKQKYDQYEYSCFENKDHYQFRYIEGSNQNGIVEWNDTKTKLVAIDGQHRLSALKNVHTDSDGREGVDFDNWSIPVVLFGVRSIDEEITKDQRTLDIIRRTFIYINTEAREPTPTRQILLNDSKVNEICTQEFVNYFHNNDCSDTRDPNILPLFLFDWRGSERGSRVVHTPGTIKTVAEIRDWLEFYVMGENFSPEQENILGLEPRGETEGLKSAFHLKSLSPANVKSLRDLFNKKILPGLVQVIQEFTPIKNYGSKVRSIEEDFLTKSSEARHAFSKFRFGTSRAHSTLYKIIDQHELKIIEEIDSAKDSCIPDLIRKDIGMRGIIYAYGKIFRDLHYKLEKDFLEYSEWYKTKINVLYEEGWFGPFKGSNAASTNRYKYLRHIAYSHTDEIINYRLDDSRKALGCLITMIILSKAYADDELDKTTFLSSYNFQRDILQSTVTAGFKKQVRPKVVEDLPNDSNAKAINAEIKKRAENLAGKHLKMIDDELSVGED